TGPRRRRSASQTGRTGELFAVLLCEPLNPRVVVAVGIGKPRNAVIQLPLQLLTRPHELGQRARIGSPRPGAMRPGVGADLDAAPLEAANLLPGEEARVVA